MTFIYIWFGTGLFVSAMNLLQWYYDGAKMHEPSKHTPYKWINQHLTNAFLSFFVGPIVLLVQLTNGMQVIPRKEQ